MFLIQRENRFPASTPKNLAVLRRQVGFTRPFKSFSHLLLSWAAILLLQFVHVIKYLKPFLLSPYPHPTPSSSSSPPPYRSTNRFGG